MRLAGGEKQSHSNPNLSILNLPFILKLLTVSVDGVDEISGNRQEVDTGEKETCGELILLSLEQAPARRGRVEGPEQLGQCIYIGSFPTRFHTVPTFPKTSLPGPLLNSLADPISTRRCRPNRNHLKVIPDEAGLGTICN
jgi:hypothetical protein